MPWEHAILDNCVIGVILKIRMLLNEVLPEGIGHLELPVTKEAPEAMLSSVNFLGHLQFLSIWECNRGLELVSLLVMLLTFLHLFLADIAVIRHDLEETRKRTPRTEMWGKKKEKEQKKKSDKSKKSKNQRKNQRKRTKRA